MRKLLLSAIGLALAIAPAFAQCDQGRLRTSLIGGSIRGLEPSGHVDFLTSSGLTRLTAEVEDVNLPAGTRLRVLVDKSEVGAITIGTVPVRGGELELDTRDGVTVPKLKENSLVEIWAADRPVMAGVLQQKCAGDTRSRRDDDPEVARKAACAARSGDELRVRTHLRGGNIGGLEPEGHAELHVRSGQKRDLHFSAEVEDINLPANSKLDVFVGGSRVGSINVGSGALRGGELRLDSRDGQEVPEIRGSTLVRVVTPEGAPVLTGVMQPEAVCDDNPGAGGSSSSTADDSRQRGRLGGGALNGFEPSGYAEFRTRSSRNDARLHVELEDVNLPAGAVLDVLVDGHRMGTMRVGPAPIRGAELELDSRDGDNLPRLSDDSANVTILAPRGVVVAAGVLRVRSMGDNPSAKPEDRSIASRGRGADDPPGDDRGGKGANEPGDDKGGGSGGGSGSGSGGGSGGSGGSGSGSGSSGSGSGKP